jgi:serine phosphatase RsbU (regulator of sigma subunit)
LFGDERLRQVVTRAAGMSVDALGQRILDAVRAFVGDAPPHDDLSLMILKRRA